jgi:hypothetical protein
MKYSYDEKCLDLARYFYPRQSIAFLEALAQAFQDCVEGREDTEDQTLQIPDFLRNQDNLRAERAEMETFSCLGGCGASVPSNDAYCSACFLLERQAQMRPPKGQFWRGAPESNRHTCRNCGEHYDKHLHTDEASTCPTANRSPEQ